VEVVVVKNGRPGLPCEVRVRFWDGIRAGLGSRLPGVCPIGRRVGGHSAREGVLNRRKRTATPKEGTAMRTYERPTTPKEGTAMRTYERPTLTKAGSFKKLTGIGGSGPRDFAMRHQMF
jgi:hypothetical protein